ncbi:MAG TPA: HNH endonuclease signature motif containing protein [Gemmataceae bacterium]|nr:HNH endonuclease signature motif containing protein [Gemmataceae bacterium]
MTVFSDDMRAAVIARAGGCCEYCHLSTRGQVATFPIDRVVPRSSGGLTILENLALACPHCNSHKWAHVSATDSVSGTSVPLFNPRTQVWSEHFQWSRQDRGVLDGKTPCGRATIALLQINDPDMLTIRQLLARVGLFPEIEDGAG